MTTVGQSLNSEPKSSNRVWLPRLDLKSKQLVALICGELFLVWRERITQTMKPSSVTSNGRHFRGSLPQLEVRLGDLSCSKHTGD